MKYLTLTLLPFWALFSSFLYLKIPLPAHCLYPLLHYIHLFLVFYNLSSAKRLFFPQIIIGHPLLAAGLDTVVRLVYQIQAELMFQLSLRTASISYHNDLILVVVHWTLLPIPCLPEVFICVFTAADSDVFPNAVSVLDAFFVFLLKPKCELYPNILVLLFFNLFLYSCSFRFLFFHCTNMC